MAVSPGTAYTWRRLDLSLVLVLNTLSTYALSYFTLPWLATLAITAVACYCAVTGIYSILLLKKVRASLRSPHQLCCCVSGRLHMTAVSSIQVEGGIL